ncbi:hypothetical protein CASFOL_012360 [Castilleja foliolosa]|uniref:MATH domain-containing protein n=1 Tax=Castilleja foliolosa TaxID=1961234 RepID=A0ABD3DKZ6_9LAMI
MYLQGPVEEVELETREASPAHSLIKIDSFSLLEKRGISKVETREFTAGKYKWKLVIYPNGHVTEKDEEHYVSIYLAIAGTDDLPSKWEVNATFSICVFNHFSGNFRYSLDNAEFKITNFSTLKEKWVSEEFTVGSSDTWMIEVYPNGCGKETGRSLSIYLRKVVWNNCASTESVRPCFIFRIKNQLNDHGHHGMISPGGWLSAPNITNAWKWDPFIELSVLKDPNKGFIVNDCCVIEIEITPQAISF